MESVVDTQKANKKSKNQDVEVIAKKLHSAALGIAENEGYTAITISRAAKVGGVPLGDAIYLYPSVTHLLSGLLNSIDKQILESLNLTPLEGDEVREKLFELMMRHFDTIQATRGGFLAIINHLYKDPRNLAIFSTKLLQMLTWFLDASGATGTGLAKNLQVKALGVIYLFALNSWKHDDTEDLSKTMATLDRALCEAEKIAKFLK